MRVRRDAASQRDTILGRLRRVTRGEIYGVSYRSAGVATGPAATEISRAAGYGLPLRGGTAP